MPLIISQSELADGVRLIRNASVQGLVQITSADLTATVKSGTIAACETFVNNLLATKLAGADFSAQVKVKTIVPLTVSLMTGPVGFTFPAQPHG